MISDQSVDETTRIIALWALEGLAYYDESLTASLLKSASPWELRREVIRSLINMPITEDKLATYLKPFVTEKNVMLRTQALRTIKDFGKVNNELIDILVSFCQPDSESDKLGGDYERKQERFLARYALESYAYDLGQYLKTDLAKAQPKSHIEWASKAFEDSLDTKAFLHSWNKVGRRVTADNIRQVSLMLKDEEVAKELLPAFKKKDEAETILNIVLNYRSAIQNPELEKALKPTIKIVAQINKKLALAAAAQFKDNSLLALAAEELVKSDDKLVQIDALYLLQTKPKAHVAAVSQAFEKSQDSFVKSLAFITLVKAQAPEAKEKLKAYVTSLSAADKNQLIFSLSEFKEGAKILLTAYAKEELTTAEVKPSIVKDIAQFVRAEESFKRLKATSETQEAAAKKAIAEKVHRYETIVKKGLGKAENGKGLFTALCLSCHVVGAEGAAFAPALDGSAHRDLEGLLTAIVDPDAAAEGSYYRYKVEKIDGSFIEGYKELHDHTGVTLRFMGGAKIVIPQSQVRRAFFTSQSVMPAGLIEGLGEQQVADLIAYIKSLK